MPLGSEFPLLNQPRPARLEIDTNRDFAAPPVHPSTQALLQYFSYEHLTGDLRATSQLCSELAHTMAERGAGPELTAGLRKLLEAKDCFVRAAL